MLCFAKLLGALRFTAHSLPCSATFHPSWALYCALIEEVRAVGAASDPLPPDLTCLAAPEQEPQAESVHVVEVFLKEFQDVSQF